MLLIDLMEAKHGYGRWPGSHDWPAELFDLVYEGKLDNPADLAECVADAWSGAKIPFRALGYDTWIEFFRRAGYSDDGKLAAPLAEPITVYRAAEPQFVHRLAWTGTLDVAKRFTEINTRYGKRPRHIYELTVTPDRVLAHITDRQEDEFIVDSRGLRAKRILHADEVALEASGVATKEVA
jgi:hypothetical protein